MRSFTLAFALAVVASATPGAEPFSFISSGQFPSGLPYSVALRMIAFEPAQGAAPDDGSMWGIDGGFPRHVIRDFSVRFGDTEVPVYRKYLRDLSNVVEASVVADSRGASNTLVLHLRGGDAHGSFRAELTFTDCRLTERVVRMGEFPEQVWERTEVGHFEVEACGRTRR